MTNDIPNAFIQTHLTADPEDMDRVIMKITGVLVDMLVELAPEEYGPFVVIENGKKVLYVRILKALYGMLAAALLWYKKFRKDLESIGFIFNPYDPCVANRMVNNKQQTVRFHVDDLMSSHVNASVNDEFYKWLNEQCGQCGEVTQHQGKVHDYLGMNFDFSEKGKVIVDMIAYVKAMLDDFHIKLKDDDAAPTPAPDNLFAPSEGEDLNKSMAEAHHTFTTKGFMCL